MINDMHGIIEEWLLRDLLLALVVCALYIIFISVSTQIFWTTLHTINDKSQMIHVEIVKFICHVFGKWKPRKYLNSVLCITEYVRVCSFVYSYTL